jgi:hypothetical protein
MPMNIVGNNNRNDRLLPHRSKIAGFGVFAAKDSRRCQTLGYFEGYSVNQDTEYSLTLEGKKVEPTGILRYLNHSCDPNACFEGRWLIALRDIPNGTEVCIDYFATEDTPSRRFRCNCASPKCRRQKMSFTKAV